MSADLTLKIHGISLSFFCLTVAVWSLDCLRLTIGFGNLEASKLQFEVTNFEPPVLKGCGAHGVQYDFM